MSMGIKISLPGYDASTDTDTDHFALYVDGTDDNVLIKEFARGSDDIPFTVSTPYTINHGLGYIPMFLVYGYLNSTLGFSYDAWYLIPHIQAQGTVPPYYVYADTDNIYIYNNNYVGGGTVGTTMSWYIFYDNQVGASTASITESDQVVKVSRVGVDALTSTDPNDYIFHSDLNTFKILEEGVENITYTGDGYYSFSHSVGAASTYVLYIEFPDGYTCMSSGQGITYSRDGNFSIDTCHMDDSNIRFNLIRWGGSGTAIKVSYYIFEVPL